MRSPLLMTALRARASRPYPPTSSEFTARFWQGLSEHQFLATHCDDCGRLSFPPKPFCPHCWSRAARWQALSPRGVVYSATTIHAAPQVFRSESPYQVGIVDLDAGLRIATRLLGTTSSAAAIGQPVELVVVEYDDGPLFAAQLLQPTNI
ncbi:MAG: Zn-ribbon domain-containing OB-fold protein [Hydrogenophaga sp.]|jgi:uncharacterized OB-fold protein|uniref:Zn-ribbon domain-containing OB-fold protein n=1 Tax=Polaromonas sp. TaxID=1869339 RepID=UPI00248A1DE4|nr:Zn-ribbon domain-containing OB-fold protein [Polaromonas sp.]MDI1339578.1 Zn-ribbon domain-containing OB-fold protein [Polaromonas sp.]MDP3166624.1 Zn-ribbon domain-containing OB-fold protein [Hydrogenophaga sp.]